ncbi:MAG: WD40 repeat domain-containing protein [Myxococcota bacterium]
MPSAPRPPRLQNSAPITHDPRFAGYPSDFIAIHGRLLVISQGDLVLWSREGAELLRETSVGYSQRFYPTARPGCVLIGPTEPVTGEPFRLFQVTDTALTLLKERQMPALKYQIANIHAADTEEGLYIATSDLFALCDWEQDAPLREHPLQGSARQLCFSPDGTRLAVSHGGRIELLSTADGTVTQELRCKATPSSGYVVVDWGRGGHFLTVTSSRRAHHVAVWDPATGERLHERTTYLTSHGAAAARLSPDGRIADIGFSKGMLLRMDVSTGQIRWSQEQAFTYRIAVDHDDDGDWIFTTIDQRIVPRSGRDGSARMLVGIDSNIKQLHWDRVSRKLVVQGEMTAAIYDDKGALQRRLPSVKVSQGDRAGEIITVVPTHGHRWREMRRVSLIDGTVRPWQLTSAETTRIFQEGDRLVLVNDRRDGRAGVDILSTEGRLIRFVPGEVGGRGYSPKPLFYTALSADGAWLAAVSERTLRLVGVDDGKPRFSVRARSTMKPELLAFSPNAELLAVNVGRNLSLYRLDSSDPVLALKLPRGLFRGWFLKPRRLLLLLTDGRLMTLDIAKKRKVYSGEPVVVASLSGQPGIAELTEEGVLHAASQYGGALYRFDLKKLLKIRKPRRTAPPPWDPAVQVLAERDRLLALEAAQGITDEHRRVTAALLAHPAARARLCHRFGHASVLSSHAVSPDGRYLATGCWTSGDYDRGGALMVWELATGRPLTVIDGVTGGIGWPDEDGCMAWSPDGEELGVIFHTNAFGNYRVFDPEPARSATVDATDGWDSPPTFCWAPDGRAVAISCWGRSPIPGLVATLERGSMHHDEMRSFAAALPDWAAEQGITELSPATRMRWSQDGQTLLCDDRGTLYAVDLPTGQLLWHDYGGTPAFSPAGRWVATGGGEVAIRAARTGEAAFTVPDIPGISALIWAPCADDAEAPGLLAAVVTHDDPAQAGVILVRGGARVGRVPVQPSSRPARMEDTVVWVFSPDGRQGACLEASGGVSVWQLDGAEPVRIAGPFLPDGEAGAVALGGGSVALIGRELVQIWRIADGACLSHYTPASPRTDLIDTPSPLGELGSRFLANPAFPLHDADGAPHWVVALEGGTVIAPKAVQAGLDAELSWVIEGRWAWPWRWGEAAVHTTLKQAADADALPFDSDEISARL